MNKSPTTNKYIKIRKAYHGDIESVKQCIESTYTVYIPLLGRRPAAMDQDIDDLVSKRWAHVAVLHDEVIGVIMLVPGADHLQITSLAVLPMFQRRGIGRKLMAYAETKAKHLQKNRLLLYTNQKLTMLISYYEKLGFVETERRKEHGFERVFMMKYLNG